MKLEQFLLVVVWGGGRALDLQINGEISFDLKMADVDGAGGGGGGSGEPRMREDDHVTAGSVVECMYQYPEQEQINAILSNMMNELTKVFVRAQDYFTNDGRRLLDSRFRVVGHKKTHFFEEIYHNMTEEYSNFYNTSSRVSRAGRDPCQQQQELRREWRALLDHSLATFRRAALTCIDRYLKVERSNDRIRSRLGQFLVRELGKVRANQLHLLCDHFQLCYYDLF